MARILGLDFETDGLVPGVNRVIEIGASLWDTEKKKPLFIFNHLVNPGVDVSEEITKITKIHDSEVKEFGVKPLQAFDELCALMQKADAVVAHNGLEFDKKFFEAECKRLGIDVIGSDPFKNMIWIDTMWDVEYDEDIEHKNLTYLSAAHGFVNPFPHHAFADALSMLKILSNYDINTVMHSASQPLITLWADVHYNDKDKAKGLGYQWEPISKRWLKKLREHKAQAEYEKAQPLGVKLKQLGTAA